jgi:tetratricopeptide (TPR) repeat protein
MMSKSSLLSNIGVIYEENKRFSEAEKYYDEALLLATRANSHELIANVANNRGSLYRDRGNNELAFKYMQEAMEIRRQNKNKFGLARSYLSLGQLYFENLKDYKSSEDHLQQAILIGREVSSLQTVNSAYEHLYKLYQEKGDYKNAYESLKSFQQTRDSLFNEENSKHITQLEMQFEFDRKQAKLEADQKAKELYYWMGGGGLLLLLVIVTLLFFLQRSRAERSELEQVRLGLEKTNLKNELALKDKELATNIMYLINKNELINTISEKLLEIKNNLNSESQNPIHKIILELQSNLQPELWKEFEFRFQQVHEQFYRSLNDRFPDLTPSERRLCAFLKLNMSTKEISALTHQNAKSIDVARTRLRKKLSLTGTDHNLIAFLESLDGSKSS